MTAYVSRLFPRPGRPAAGIRKRPRSRYEPAPETYLGHAPSEFDMEPSDEELSADRTPTGHPHRRHAVDPAATPNVISKPAPTHTLSASAGPTAPPDQFEADQPGEPGPNLGVEAAVRTEPADALPGSLASTSDVPATRVTPANERQNNYAAVPAHSEIPPAAMAEPGPERSVYPRQGGRPSGRPRMPASPEPAVNAARGTQPEKEAPLTEPATSLQPTNARAHGDLSATHHPPTPWPNAKSPDRAVRQKIADAIAEPMRVQTTEVVVNIDRIDIRTPTTSPPAPPEPRGARAAPTSLESYLRSRSRRGGR
jgi:hypothetical protein